jgi:DNA-directed RNA polymerase specialized sigma24 family protein
MEISAESTYEPITVWIRQLEMGQLDATKQLAAQQLWNHFCQRLMDLARSRLASKLRRTYDEEDVALSAFHSLCRAISLKDDARQNNTGLGDRIDLWKLLIVIADRKILNRVREESRQRRSIHRTLEECQFVSDDFSNLGLASIVGRDPSPEFAAESNNRLGVSLCLIKSLTILSN